MSLIRPTTSRSTESFRDKYTEIVIFPMGLRYCVRGRETGSPRPTTVTTTALATFMAQRSKVQPSDRDPCDSHPFVPLGIVQPLPRDARDSDFRSTGGCLTKEPRPPYKVQPSAEALGHPFRSAIKYCSVNFLSLLWFLLIRELVQPLARVSLELAFRSTAP